MEMGDHFYKKVKDVPAQLNASLLQAERAFEAAAKYFGEVS